MYTEEYLRTYSFFDQQLKAASCASIHDSLTGIIARHWIVQFVHSLIDEGKPFTLVILDLDNFKDINDHYGHKAGDKVLSTVADGLKRFVGTSGVAGRLGGDEFLAVVFGYNEYDAIHGFFTGIFGPEGVFRKNIEIGGESSFITATIGSAAFPRNAQDYDTLFAKVDKALYRGKSKGRNCFIIYVPEKHDALEIPLLSGLSLYDAFRSMADEFDAGGEPLDCLRRAVEPLRNHLRVSRLLYISPDGDVREPESGLALGHVENIKGVLDKGLCAATNFYGINAVNPELVLFFKSLGLESVLLMEAGPDAHCGVLAFCPEPRTMHLWQEKELAAAFMLCRLLAQSMEKAK